jgi:hypothetical protein
MISQSPFEGANHVVLQRRRSQIARQLEAIHHDWIAITVSAKDSSVVRARIGHASWARERNDDITFCGTPRQRALHQLDAFRLRLPCATVDA